LFCKVSYGDEVREYEAPLPAIIGKIPKLVWILRNQKPGVITPISNTKEEWLGKN